MGVHVPAKTVRFGFYSLWMTCDNNYSLMRTFIRAKSASVGEYISQRGEAHFRAKF